jgi:hypothetical protein
MVGKCGLFDCALRGTPVKSTSMHVQETLLLIHAHASEGAQPEERSTVGRGVEWSEKRRRNRGNTAVLCAALLVDRWSVAS